MSETLNHIAEKWFAWEYSMLWQVGVLIIIIYVIDLLTRKWLWPQVRYALWLLILVKLILPPTLTSPTSFTSNIPILTENSVKLEYFEPPSATPIEAESIAPIPELATSEIVPAERALPVEEVVPVGVSLSWKAVIFLIWLAGIVVLSSWLIIRLRNLRYEHLTNGELKKLPERDQDLLERAAKRLNLKTIPQVILSDKVGCPAVFGIFRPVLLIPSDKLKNLSREDLEHIFLHELSHIKRGDLYLHAIYMMLQIAYWFNPLLWLIRRQLQNLRELCCDATVARVLKEKTAHYRETLLETARQLLAEPVDPGLGLLGLFENSNRLVDRLKWLERKPWKNRGLRNFTVLVLIGLMGACVIPMAKGDKDGNEVSLPLEDKLTLEDKAPSEPFIAKLPNGVTVELVALFTGKSKEDLIWWRPDGHPLSSDEVSAYARHVKSDSFRYESDWRLEYGYVLRFQPFHKLSVDTYNTVGLGRPGSRPKKGFSVGIVETDKWMRDHGLSSEGEIHVAVANGFWETKSIYDNTRHPETFILEDDSILMLSRLRDHRDYPQYSAIDVSYNARNLDIRLRFELKTGESFLENYHFIAGGPDLARPSGTPATLRQGTFMLDTKKENITKFHIEYRRFHKAVFKNVSLKPNTKTNVKIEVEKTVAQIEAFKAPSRKGFPTLYLPNIDKTKKMLVLHSGKLLTFTGVMDVNDIFTLLDKEGKSAVFYAGEKGKGHLVFIRCKILNRKSTNEESLSAATFAFDECPIRFEIETFEGIKYAIKILEANDYLCTLNVFPRNPQTSTPEP